MSRRQRPEPTEAVPDFEVNRSRLRTPKPAEPVDTSRPIQLPGSAQRDAELANQETSMSRIDEALEPRLRRSC